MLYKMMRAEADLKDPVEHLNTESIKQRMDLSLYKEKCPKRRIRDRVRVEYETVDALNRELNSMVSRANLWMPGLGDLERSITGGNYRCRELLWQHPLWQQYAAFVQQRPLKGKAVLDAILSGVSHAREELYIQFATTEKGESGEDRVAEYLELFKGKYIVLNNVLINSRTSARAQTAETDFCIITNKGIAVCEVKNYGNEHQTLRISRDGRWELTRGNSAHGKVLTPSPAAQNTIHCREIECFLEEKGYHDIPLIPVIIVPNNKVEIKNESANYVIRMEELYNVLERDPHPICLHGVTLQRIAAVLQSEEVEERWFDVTGMGDKVSRVIPFTEEILRLYSREAAWYCRLANRVTAIVSADLSKQLQEDHKQIGLRKWMYIAFAGLAAMSMSFSILHGSPLFLQMFATLPLVWTVICLAIQFAKKRLNIRLYAVGLIVAAVSGGILGAICGTMSPQDVQFIAGRIGLINLGAIGVGVFPVVMKIKERLGY